MSDLTTPETRRYVITGSGRKAGAIGLYNLPMRVEIVATDPRAALLASYDLVDWYLSPTVRVVP